MSTYTKTTNFTAKDNLTSGDPAKVIKGSEFDTEFNSIETAVNSKADANNGTHTGTTTISTADVDTLQIDSVEVTATSAELNKLDGFTGTVDDLNYAKDLRATGVTAAELDKIDGLTADSTELNILDGATVTTAELNTLDGITASTAELNVTDGLTATTAELNTLDGITSTTAELNVLDGITTTTAELNVLDGVTSTTAEINKLDGFTGSVDDLNYAKDLRATGVTTAELDVLDGITASTAELNITDGLTATTAELNTLDGITATTAELNYTDGVTSNIQTQLNGKATSAQGSLADSAVQPDDDVSFGTGDFSGDVDVTGTVTADGLTVDTGGTAVVLNHSATGPTLRFNNLDQTVADGQQLARIEFSTDDGGSTTDEAYLQLTATGGGGAADFDIMVGDGTPVKRARFGVGGDVSFYEDTGTTAKMVWDSSAESLGIGTASPERPLHIASATPYIVFDETDANQKFSLGSGGGKFFLYDETDSTQRLTVDSAGNVGIGTASPSAPLTIQSNSGASSINLIGRASDGYSTIAFRNNADNATLAAFFADDSSDALQVHVAGTERMRIDSSGNVGIGTASPASALHVKSPLESINGGIRLESADGTNYATVDCNNAGNLRFYQNGSARMRLDSSGNLLVGKTSLNGNTAGFQVEPAGAIAVTRSGSTTAYFNRQTSDGEIVAFRKNGGTVGSIGTQTQTAITSLGFSSFDGITIIGNEGYTGFQAIDSKGSTAPRIRPTIDNVANLGDGAQRFKDLYLSGGVYLGGTGAANKLDDYEEGVWTPSITGSTTAGSYTSVIAVGYYTKIGNLVTVTGLFNGSTGTGAGNMQIANLPFSLVGGADSVGVIQANSGLVYPTGTVDACLYGAGSTTLTVRCTKSDGSNYVHMPYPTTAGYIRFSLTYRTAA